MRKLNKIYKKGFESLDLYKRKYVLGHNDHTKDLFLYIVDDYSEFFNSHKKDEVFFYWKDKSLHVWVDVYNENSKFSSQKRYEIFKKHIKNSILAFVKLEDDALAINPRLIISFYDKNRLISKDDYDKLALYISKDDEFESNIKY